MENSIAVIIPVFNEERTIASIIEIIKYWGKASEIIIINDGSTDQTLKAIKQFHKDIILIDNKINKGKGFSMAAGIEKCQSEIILMLDGDMVGLTTQDLDLLINTFIEKKADMLMGIGRLWTLGYSEPFNDLTGIRVVKCTSIVSHTKAIRRIGYGLELYLNELFKKSKVVNVRLHHVFFLKKTEKQSLPDATLSHIKEIRELVAQLVRQQAGDLTPQAKKIFKDIQNYLKQALDYLK